LVAASASTSNLIGELLPKSNSSLHHHLLSLTCIQMKIKNFPLLTTATIAIILSASSVVQAQRFVDVIGNPPYGADPVNGVIGSGATPNKSSNATFENGVQSKINAVSANLTAASVSGSQPLGGNTIEVDSNTAEAVLAVMNTPVGASTPASNDLITALGGGDAAGQLARSLQGLRSSDGSINPVILTGAASSYNSYIKSLIDSSQATQKPASELDSFIQKLPPGQKATQVILGKLLEATR
jgi:hypothetical protein